MSGSTCICCFSRDDDNDSFSRPLTSALAPLLSLLAGLDQARSSARWSLWTTYIGGGSSGGGLGKTSRGRRVSLRRAAEAEAASFSGGNIPAPRRRNLSLKSAFSRDWEETRGRGGRDRCTRVLVLQSCAKAF